MGSRESVTIEEVAAAAGVSRSTVSRVVNGSSAVSPEALEAVKEAIHKLNYMPNRAARSLASKQTNALALVVPEDTTRFFGDPFFAAIVSGINTRLGETDYVLNLFIASDDPRNKTTRYLLSGAVDGAFIVSHHTSDTFLEQIRTAVPVVFGGRPVAVRSSDHYVDVDNRASAKMATEYLISRGHERIGSLTGPLDMPAGMDRRAGYLEAMEEHGLVPGPEEEGAFTADSGAEAMRRLIARGPLPDALFIANDLMARAAVGVLQSHGVKVPGDIAVAGFDDSQVAASGTPGLTTVRQPSLRQGRAMADVLLDLLAGGSPSHATILETELVIRDSTR